MTELETAGGILVHRTTTPIAPAARGDRWDTAVAAVGRRRGGVLGSGMRYPGRYTLWHVVYHDPCLEIVARSRLLTVRALNARGAVLLPAVARAVRQAGEIRADDHGAVTVFVPPAEAFFTEEERSRQPTVFSVLRAIKALFRCDDPHLGLYGAFGYDLALQFEPLRLKHARPGDQRDLVLHLADRLQVVDGERGTAELRTYDFVVDGVSTAGIPRDTEPTPPLPDRPEPRPAEAPAGSFARLVHRAKERFAAGDLFEVTPGQVLYGSCDAPDRFFERLRGTNPAPYEFFFNLGGGEYLVGASPEMFVRVGAADDGGLRVETCPIAGTIRRGTDALEDAERVRTLLSSDKDESELTMCTDVDRNDKSRVCVPGSVRVLGRRQIEMYSRVIHTVDHVEGRLRPGFDAFDAFLTHMWAVTVTGAPKAHAMQFIEDNEDGPRRWYGGAVGFVGFDGSMDTGLTLRSAQIRNGVAAIRAGATLLYRSDPDAEEQEIRLKAGALLDVLSPDAAGGGIAPSAAPEPEGAGLRVLLVDHEDSFVHTLADYFRQHGAAVTTVRHGFPAALLDDRRPDLVVLSPGPGRPADFGTAALLRACERRRLPVFGVCLGLQAIVEYAGGGLRLLDEPAHGVASRVKVSGGALFAGVPGEFTAARYHSLSARPGQVGRGLRVTAAAGNVVMAVEDLAGGRWAVQFHPESILTSAGDVGRHVIANALRLARRFAASPPRKAESDHSDRADQGHDDGAVADRPAAAAPA